MGYHLRAETAAGPRAEGRATRHARATRTGVGSGYRYYSPGLARWVNRDPIGEEGGEHLYAWVENGGVWAVDPRGRSGIGTIVKYPVKAILYRIRYPREPRVDLPDEYDDETVLAAAPTPLRGALLRGACRPFSSPVEYWIESISVDPGARFVSGWSDEVLSSAYIPRRSSGPYYEYRRSVRQVLRRRYVHERCECVCRVKNLQIEWSWRCDVLEDHWVELKQRHVLRRSFVTLYPGPL